MLASLRAASIFSSASFASMIAPERLIWVRLGGFMLSRSPLKNIKNTMSKNSIALKYVFMNLKIAAIGAKINLKNPIFFL